MIRRLIVSLSCLSFLLCSLVAPAQAAMLDTAELVAVERQTVTREALTDMLQRDEVRAQLTGWGVAPALADARVAALTDAEIAELALTMDQQPAGAGGLEVLGIVFIVLLVLELVGVINIFNKV